ncbi:hypothetical protein K8354_13250 [Polaribacter litorisediminis]|uniref:hypothetical protein n=1 Tax=Polaribacter litorisediminis TaxID=1908341 RepID=UPI001CC0E9CF|nr:hypothetical protein [Polaribacter litorisediminis]UAM97280.1 hypothetical protein K8354_13250 [Polaribacter litorisediminis]
MENKYNFYDDIKEFVAREYGGRVINSEIQEKELDKLLWLQIDLGCGILYEDYEELWFPKLNPKTSRLEKNISDMHELLNIEIDSNLIASFYLYGTIYYEGLTGWEGDGEEYVPELYSFSLELLNLETLKEIIDFFSEIAKKPKFRLVEEFKFKEIKLTDIFENIYVYVPYFSKNILPYKNFVQNFSFIDLKKIFDELYNAPNNCSLDEMSEISIEDQYSKCLELISDKINEQKKVYTSNLDKIKPTTSFNKGDIGCNLDYSTFSFSDVNGIDEERNLSISLVFRLAKNNSYFFIREFLSKSIEGKNIMANLFDKKHPTSIEFIQGKYTQLQFILEDCINRNRMKSQLNSLLNNVEHFKLRNILTRKRLQYLNLYYDEQHKLIEMYENPLPFVIEKAYRDYVRSDSEMDMATSGLHLLNILIKTRLFFPLEEYMLSDKIDEDFIKIIEQEFYNKKPSDGTFSRIQSILNKILIKNNILLECFGTFNDDLSSKSVNYIFNEIVSIRNRFAHPPYDSKAFMDTLSHYIPGLIDTYRIAMANIDFLIPQSFKTKNKTIIMSAKKLMGFESKFETIEITISQDEILNFEVGEFITYNSKTKKTVLLSKFIDLKTDLEPTYNIGLFDGMENGMPVYR